MKRNAKILTLIVALMLCVSMVFGCAKTGGEDSGGDSGTGSQGSGPSGTTTPVELKYASGTTLRMATGYNNANTGIVFDAKTISDYDAKDGTADGKLTLSNGVSYQASDLKPTWEEVQNRLDMKFESKWQGSGSAEKEFNYWKEQLDQVDMVSGSATVLQEAGASGKLVNIANYLDSMPNFSAYLKANPIVRLSITGSASGKNKGAIYFSPYFDGVNDIERMPLMRVDYVIKLLNGSTAFTATASKNLNAAVYTPYMPTSGKVEVDVVKKDGSATEKVTKDYDKAGNIVKKMNDALAAGTVSGVDAVNMLRTYIDEAYNGYYGENRADLFIGQNAAWDADELVALLRCVVANPQSLNGTDTIQGLFSREENNNQRRVDLFRFAGSLLGVRGLESRQDYLFFDKDGNLHDARQEVSTYKALEKMNAMMQEGLISSEFNNNDSKSTSATYLENDNGFMGYDYNQTQTIMNGNKLNQNGQSNEKYMAVMVPVAKWNDGTGDAYFRFTESWRSVKTDGWAISLSGINNNNDKLYAALKLVDYAYSKEGQILMSYGPDAFIKVKNANGTTVEDKYETFDFNGEQWPVISDGCQTDLMKLENGNYTNFARRFLGSTLSFAKSQAFEYQCTHEVGKEGAGYISKAIKLKTIKHPELAICENMWYTSIPTTFPTTANENTALNSSAELTSNGKFSQSKNQSNLLVDLISGGYTKIEFADAEAISKQVSSKWGGSAYLLIKSNAWERVLNYYNEINPQQ